ncbi:MAG: hypothetical protein OXI05_10605 [Bacteroidota bacterium]|nr:hypothetical protein [Bacteroidota bacterium]
MTKDKGEILDSKPGSLRDRAQKASTDHIRKELAPILEALKGNQMDLQTCVRQVKRLLHVQQEPWKKAGTMLWGIVLGVLLFALLQPRVQYTHDACALGNKIMAASSTLSDSERTLIERITSE